MRFLQSNSCHARFQKLPLRKPYYPFQLIFKAIRKSINVFMSWIIGHDAILPNGRSDESWRKYIISKQVQY